MDYPISVPSVGLVGGKFVDEDPVAGTPGSLIPSAWGNAVTDEMLNVIIEAGLTPTEGENDQLKQAIAAIIADHATTQLATQEEAEAGTDNTKRMSPLRVFQAINKVIVQATETVLGKARVATQAQTNAGTDDATFVTPLKLRLGFNAIFGINGGVAFPSWLGGWIINWGFQASATSGTIVYPIAYTTRAYGIFCQYTHATPVGVSHSITPKNLALSGLTSVPFVSTVANEFQWFGFGK